MADTTERVTGLVITSHFPKELVVASWYCDFNIIFPRRDAHATTDSANHVTKLKLTDSLSVW
jgi:hypothetical protein